MYRKDIILTDNCENKKIKKILILDDHNLMLRGTLGLLEQKYGDAEIVATQTKQEALKQLENFQPDVFLMDLGIPETIKEQATVSNGLELILILLDQYPELNIIVLSAQIKKLVRIKHKIEDHLGGFTIADKNLNEEEILRRVSWSFQGIIHTRDLKSKKEFKPSILELLELANQGLQDEAIAHKMNISNRTVSNYWNVARDILEVYPEEDDIDFKKNKRQITLNQAREAGFID